MCKNVLTYVYVTLPPETSWNEVFIPWPLWWKKIGENLILTTGVTKFLFWDFKNVKIFPFCSVPPNDIFFFFFSSSHQYTLFFCHLPKHSIGISSSMSLLVLFSFSCLSCLFKCYFFSKIEFKSFFLYIVTSSLISAQSNFYLNRWKISEEKWELLKIKWFQNWKV